MSYDIGRQLSLEQQELSSKDRNRFKFQNKEMMLQDVQESRDALQKEVARLTNHPGPQKLVARRTKTHQKALLKAYAGRSDPEIHHG
ncbi:Uncharacterized protein HZ326_15427 [Fusarium oxysporum f. sp. albedinis]|nr:Uncharacterized protein HZ326_15427 [Fusarium oxysporum f. sp. albedinis]